MTQRFQHAQTAMAFAAGHLSEDVGLERLATEASLSPYHLHRVFAAVAGETPKEFTTRLRLGRAAALLLTTELGVLRVALECGFDSHEGFTRAFRKRFGMTPSAYRSRGFMAPTSEAEAVAHRETVAQAAPCLGLYRYRESHTRKRTMTHTITKQTLDPQPVLVQRRRASQGPEISQAIGEALGAVFAHAQRHGIALTGQPFTRYPEVGPGMMTLEPGMRVASGDAGPTAAEGAVGEVRADTLPGGPVAMTLHQGPYDTLHEAYAALEKWMESEGVSPSGAPWEVYITDPTEVENPADWKTEIYWPLR